MVDTVTPYPNSGGGGNAGSSFSDNLFNIYNETDRTKLIAFDASQQATGTQLTLKPPTGLSTTPRTLALAEYGNSFTDSQSITDTGGACLALFSTQIAGGGGFITVTDTVSALTCSLLGPPAGFTAARDLSWQDASGAMVLSGNGADPPAAGHMGKVNRTAQAAAIGSTLLTNACAAGYYLVHYTIADTSTQAGVATIQFQINYTDDAGATTQTGAALSLTATGRDRGVFQVYLASGDITYQTNLVGIIGTGRYALRVRIEALP